MPALRGRQVNKCEGAGYQSVSSLRGVIAALSSFIGSVSLALARVSIVSVASTANHAGFSKACRELRCGNADDRCQILDRRVHEGADHRPNRAAGLTFARRIEKGERNDERQYEQDVRPALLHHQT